MINIMIFSIVLVVVIFALFAVAISKGYSYKHKIDPIDQNPHLDFLENKESNKE